jgi:hypothetical protein
VRATAAIRTQPLRQSELVSFFDGHGIPPVAYRSVTTTFSAKRNRIPEVGKAV